MTYRYILRFFKILFCRETEGAAECSCWIPFVGACARMMHQQQVRGQHRITFFFEASFKINKN